MTTAPWLLPLPDAAQQRALDEWAIGEQGIPGIELMERAGAGLARLAARHAPRGTIAIVCGKGNNGGDGLVAARLLRDRGREVRVLLLGPGEELRGDARANLERLPGAPPEPFAPAGLAGAIAVVDAILGTGFAGAPRQPAAGAIAAINAAGKRAAAVVACDIPSGVDGSTGEVAGTAVRADATATFHAGKPGLWINPGKSHAGEVTVVDIGIPASDPPAGPAAGLIDEAVLDVIPRRDAAATKFSAGSVLVCGGSAGLTGAPCLAAMAAARAGAGYVTAAVPASLQPVFALKLLEVMSAALPDDGGALTEDAIEDALGRVMRVDALVLGPGLGRAEPTRRFARALAARAEVPLVLDADGLNAHSGALGELAGRRPPTVLTPHAGELARLLGCDSAAVGARRLACARQAATTARAVVVLKGDDTIVANPSGLAAVSAGDAPALATAGTGDVLAGITAAYLAKGMEPFAAACAAVFVHTAAGRLAGGLIGAEGVIAGDIIELLPRVRAPHEE